MRILYVTTIGGTMGFFKSFIAELINEGSTVDIATNENIKKVPDCYREWGCNIHNISCTRFPLNKGTLKAVKEIKKLVAENEYDIVHCHTPIAAMCTRIACRRFRKNGLKVIYTAHGFHFYKGAPLKNWLIYYPIEKICSHFTDVLITINKEDYELADKKMNAEKIEYVPGVGFDVNRFFEATVDKEKKRREMGVPEDAILLLSVGEINLNKNHQLIIKAMKVLDNHNIYYAIAGEGAEKENLVRLAGDLELQNNILLLGRRNDIAELCKTADIFCFPSYREGLGIASLEAMACGLPIVTSNVHGINDYSEDGVTGYKFSPYDVEGAATAIEKTLASDLKLIGNRNKCIVCKYDKKVINSQLKEIYNNL